MTWKSPFSAPARPVEHPPTPKVPPEPPQAPAQAVARPVAILTGVPLAEQIAEAVKAALESRSKVSIYAEAGFTPNTLTRVLSGEGLRVETVEKLATVLGWTIHVTDAQGHSVALLHPQGGLPEGGEGP